MPVNYNLIQAITMHKLFVLSHLRALARLGIGEFSPSAWEEAVARNTLAPSGDGLLYRLPREELKHTLNTVCPVNRYLSLYAVCSSHMLRTSSWPARPCGVTSRLTSRNYVRGVLLFNSARMPKNRTLLYPPTRAVVSGI